MFWSSIYGSILGDEGRYDAFETVMEILRMKLQYPDLDPAKYAAKDEAFRRFMHCEEGEWPLFSSSNISILDYF